MCRKRQFNGLNQISYESETDYIYYMDSERTYGYDGRGNLRGALNEDTAGMIYEYYADGTMSGMSHRPGRGAGGWSLTQTMKYDHNGIRSEKTVGGQKTDHYYAEGKSIVSAAAYSQRNFGETTSRY